MGVLYQSGLAYATKNPLERGFLIIDEYGCYIVNGFAVIQDGIFDFLII